MRMRFETMELDNKNMVTSHGALQHQYNAMTVQLAESNSTIKQLELENTRLKQHNELQSIEIDALKQKMANLEASSGLQLNASCVLTVNDENTNTSNTVSNTNTNTASSITTNGPSNGTYLDRQMHRFYHLSSPSDFNL